MRSLAPSFLHAGRIDVAATSDRSRRGGASALRARVAIIAIVVHGFASMRPPLHRSPTSRHDAHRPRGAGRFVHRSNRTRMADGIAHIVRGACSNHRSARASSHFLAPSRAFSL
ncbi:hypothetical protein, partial [Burkholderia pseudomallei]